MKLGLIARADNSGLGMQTWEFYRHMKPAKTMVVDISHLNGNKVYPERYMENQDCDVQFIKGFPSDEQVESFLQGLDCVFIAEAAYNHKLYNIAREMGVKTAVQYNYEFMDWLSNNDYPRPDMLIAPSRWHYADVQRWCDDHGVKHVYLHCPVAREKLPPRTIKQARTFLHVAGRAAAHDRNGTETVIKASKYLRTNARIAIHFQGAQGLAHQATTTYEGYEQMRRAYGGHNLEMSQIEYENYQDVYNTGDVLLLPRRYGGNCLPLNEALSVGMPVLMTDISPNQGFLPSAWLIPATKVDQFTPRTVIDIYGADPQALAQKIDEFYDMNESQMWFENIRASNLARSISWDSMKPQYEEALRALCIQ